MLRSRPDVKYYSLVFRVPNTEKYKIDVNLLSKYLPQNYQKYVWNVDDSNVHDQLKWRKSTRVY